MIRRVFDTTVVSRLPVKACMVKMTETQAMLERLACVVWGMQVRTAPPFSRRFESCGELGIVTGQHLVSGSCQHRPMP